MSPPTSPPELSFLLVTCCLVLFYIFTKNHQNIVEFLDGRHDGHHGFPIGMILAIFDLQVTPMLPTKYQVNWPRGVGGVGF